MNVTEIINLIREYVDEPSADGDNGDYPDSALIQFINAEHRHLISVTRQFYEDWLGREYIFPVTDGTWSYTLPREIVSPRRVELLSAGVSQVQDTYSYYVVDEDAAEITEVIPQTLLDSQDGKVLDYVTNRRRAVEGYKLWDQTIRFSTGTNLAANPYCRIFYLPTAIDLHQGVVSSVGIDQSITLGVSGAATTIGPIRRTDGYYVGAYIEIVSGAGVGEIKRISRYDPVNRVVWIDGSWSDTPDTSSVYSIVSPIIEDYQELLALGATIRAKGIKTEDDAELIGVMYTGLMEDFKTALDKRIEQRSRRVRKLGAS